MTTVDMFGPGDAMQVPMVDTRDAGRVAAASAALADLEAVVLDLDHAAAGTPTGCPGWTVFDIVAHCVSMESLIAGDPVPDHELEVEPDHVQNDTSRFIEVLLDARRDADFDTLRKDMSETFRRRQDQLAQLTDLDADVHGFVGPVAARRLLGMRTFDLWVHEQDIRRAVGRPGGFGTEAAAVVGRRLPRGLAAVLPQRVTGGSLELVVTGAQPSRTSVDLGDGDARVAMTISFEDLVPIATGRDDASDPAAVAEIDGDAAMAARILTSLVVTE